MVSGGRVRSAVYYQHGGRALHFSDGRDGGHRLHALLEAVGDYLHPWGYPAQRLAGLGDERGHAGNLHLWPRAGGQGSYRHHIACGIGIALTFSPVIYQTVEKVEMVLIGIVMVFLITALVIATDAGSWAGVVTRAPEGVANFFQSAQLIGAATLLGAIAFAGAGGANNLVQSNYIRRQADGHGGAYPPDRLSHNRRGGG